MEKGRDVKRREGGRDVEKRGRIEGDVEKKEKKKRRGEVVKEIGRERGTMGSSGVISM